MEEIPFKIVITGKIEAYNSEHADSMLDKGIRSLKRQINSDNYVSITRDLSTVVQVGDDVLYGYLNIYFPDAKVNEKMEEHYQKFINSIFDDLKEFIFKPPLFFDKTDYLKVRAKIQEKIEYWVAGRGKWNDGRYDVRAAAVSTTDAIIRACEDHIAKGIIGFNIALESPHEGE